jgi:GntR family transcriptional regulator
MFDHHHTLELDRTWVPIPDIVAARLEVDAGQKCLRFEYVASHEGDVFAVATNYVLDPEASAIGSIPLGQSWYDLLDRAQLVVGESEFVIGCMNADEHTASLLGAEPGSAMLTMEQVIRDDRDRLYNFAFVVSRGDRQSIVSRARRGHESGHPL